jgi:uncharacterized protein YciI
LDRPLVLTYRYVEKMVERRAPYRDAHLAHVKRWSSSGRLAMAGATGDPPTGALFVFEVDSAAQVEEFVASDPYGEAGLVAAAHIEPWTIVASRPLGAQVA